MSTEVAPKLDIKIGLWSLIAALVVGGIGWGKLSTDVTHATTVGDANGKKIEQLTDAINDQKINTARVEEGIKRQSDKIDYVIKLIEQKDKGNK